MAIRNYNGSDVEINYGQFMRLYESGRVRLGLPAHVAIKVISSGSYLLQNSNVRGVQISIIIFRWLVFIAFLGLVYMGFVAAWWYFIVAILGILYFLQLINGSTAGLLVKYAIEDESLYEALRVHDVWYYEMDESDAMVFMRNNVY